MSPVGVRRQTLTEGLERAATRETHVCLEGCGDSARGLIEAENHLVFAHSYSRPVAQEAIVKAAAAAAPAKVAKCTYCHRTDGTHAPRCMRTLAAARDVARRLGGARPAEKETRMSKAPVRKCRLCRKAGHRSNACPSASNGTGGGLLRATPLQSAIAQLEREIAQRQKAVKALREAERLLT